MIRYAFLQNTMLQLYRTLDEIIFPMNPDMFFKNMDNCRVMSYQKFAEINQCSFNDVVLICESKSGCTHYDMTRGKYLVLINDSHYEHNVKGRILWTKSHELGHVVLNHLPPLESKQIAENSFSNLNYSEFEEEANYFASLILCPQPLYEILDVKSSADIQRVFGLSKEASVVRWENYVTWKIRHRKTAWENDVKRLYVNQYAK